MQKLNKIISDSKKVFNKISKYCKENKRKTLMTVVLIMAVFVVLLNTSFGYFKKRIEGTKLSFNVGTLSLELDCINLAGCEIALAPNSSKVATVNLKSLNKIDTKYELYYEIVSPEVVTNVVDGGHLLKEDEVISSEILKYDTKSIELILNNFGSQEITLKLGVAPSLKNDNVSLKENQVSLNKEGYRRFYVYDYSGNYEKFIAPQDGYYRLKAWGAQGGGSNGGKGAYTEGIIKLTKGEEIYVYVGSAGSGLVGGYNGGGNAYFDNQTTTAGGGATDFRLEDGEWNNQTSLASRIMVASGGGGSGFIDSYVGTGGYGGTLTGATGTSNHSGYGTKYSGTGGSQTTGGYQVENSARTAGFGYGGYGKNNYTCCGTSGGGGGYYGGGSSTRGHNGAGGGSSYVSGYVGCVAVTSSDNISPKTGCSDGTIDENCSHHYSGKVFAEIKMIAGNQQMPTHDNLSTQTGNSGNGYASISFLGEDWYQSDYAYTGGVQTFTAPYRGYYKIEAWGGEGGYDTDTAGGKGAYTSGIIQLEKQEKLYVYVGKQGSPQQSCMFNGGGISIGAASGGDATDIRTKKGDLTSRIMVSAGGGGGENAGHTGGAAGGLQGYKDGKNQLAAATQTSGFAFGYALQTKDASVSNVWGGGGGGYYGGMSGNGIVSGGSGGSSYISGHPGCIAITSADDITPKVNTYSVLSDSYHYTGKVFKDTVMIDGKGYGWTTTTVGEKANMPTHDLTSTQTGNSGNGYAKITLIETIEDNGYILENNLNTGNTFAILPNNSEEIKVTLKNTNNESSYYELYYEIIPPSGKNNVVEAGYLSTTKDNVTGEIASNELKTINLIINNIGNDSVYIKVGAKKSDRADDSNLDENQNSFNKEVLRKYYVYDYSGNYETFTPELDGYYQLEAWGAQGGTISTSVPGGKGAYTSGIIRIKENEKIYVYVGGAGSGSVGGYNGGGDAYYDNQPSAAGGGATDFRLISGTWNNSTSLASRIMVASGGGGTGYSGSNTGTGGYGGSFIGGTGTTDSQYGTTYSGTGGSQTSGGIQNENSAKTAGFGYGGYGKNNYTCCGTSGGGSGYYGGGSSTRGHNGAGGGSSYVSGYLGCVAITSESNISPKSGCSDGTTDISCSYHYSNKIFTNPDMKAGNEKLPTHDLASTMTGNSGNGYARITLIGNGTYTIVYNANGGKGSMENAEVLDKYPYTLDKNTFTKDGYLFKGWSLSPNSDEVIYKDMASVVNLAEKEETVNLYAVWIDKYTVTFDVNGGNTLTENSKVVNVSSAYGTLPTPTKDAYDFIGWYTEKEGGKQITEDTLVTEITETLYARWKARTLDVLAYVGASSIYREGGGTYTSPTFDITNFNKLEVSCGYGQTGGGGAYSAYLVTTSGNISLLGTKTVDISGYTGNAYISISTTKVSMSGWDPSLPYDEWGETNSYWKSSGYVNLTRLFLSA